MRWTCPFKMQLASEPAGFLYYFAMGVYGNLIPSIIQQKVCSPSLQPDLNFVCNDTLLLSEATDITTIRSTIREVLPLLALLFAGWWRDTTGLNKPILFMALLGETVGVSIELIGALQWSISPMVTAVTDAVINGLFGGGKLFTVGAMLVITDNSQAENRTSRFAYFIAATIAGGCVSTGMSGYMFKYFGYIKLLSLVIGLLLLTMLLVTLMNDNERKLASGGRWESLRKLKAVTDSRPNNAVIWLMINSYCLVAVAMSGEINNMLYYLEQGFGMEVTGAGIYISYRLLVGVVSSAVTPLVFNKILKLSDFNIGIISSILCMASGIAMAFAKTTLELIIFAWLDCLKIFLLTVPKSIVTKSVKHEEIGVFMSLFSIEECLLPLVIFLVYDKIFQATSHSMPGAMFLATTTISFVVLIFFCISSYIYKVPETESLDKKDGNDLDNQEKI